MLSDLRTILEGWEYEPGKISVRKIVGLDGAEKIQTRVDLGLLQFETAGRPDGSRPHGCDSLLDFYEQRLVEHVRQEGDDADFVLTPEDCRELRHENYLYYQRYLSLFVLEEFAGVVADTERNLRAIDFCQRYGAAERDRVALENQRPYVMMMNTRAKVYAAINSQAYEAALQIVDTGLAQLQVRKGRDADDGDEPSDEYAILAELRQEVIEQMPEGARPRLEWELRNAVACEDYERAAQIRRQLEPEGDREGPGANP